AHAQDAPLGEVPLVEVPSGDRLDPALLESDPAEAAEGKRVDVQGVPLVRQAGGQENTPKRSGKAGWLAGMLANWWDFIFYGFGALGSIIGSALYAYRNGYQAARTQWLTGKLRDANGEPLPSLEAILARVEKAEKKAEAANAAAQAARRQLAAESERHQKLLREQTEAAKAEVDHVGSVQRARIESVIRPLREQTTQIKDLLTKVARIDARRPS
ncbi:MAG: hypothetical protein AAFV53_41925, partial [Myxococcota bacterium]